MARVLFRSPCALALVVLAVFVGCQSTDRRPTSMRLPLATPDPPTVTVPPGVRLCDPCGCACNTTMRPQRHVLALSSGGLYGAYSTGFLSGWTKTGTRPEFDTVTGVSVGSLVAPFAFLGPAFDGIATDLYTGVSTEDVFRIRAWVTIPFKDAVASSDPLKELIESQMTPDRLALIAEEHRKGRRLYVGTTDLETRRLVVWDMGAIASLPNGRELFRDVLLASCSVPGMLPPVQFSVPQPDGTYRTEMHVDGGVSSQIFVPSHVFAAAAQNSNGVPVAPGVNGNVYTIVAGKLFADAAEVKPRVLPILGATTESIVYAHNRAELGNLYGQARVAGMRFHLTSLRQEVPVNAKTVISIDPVEMQKLYQEGERNGIAGPMWQYAPPDLCTPPPAVQKRKKHKWR